MSHVRIFRHYVHTPFLLISASEAVLLAGAAYIGHWLAHGAFPAEPGFLLRAITFALTMLATMTAMGVYESRMREGYSAMMLRSAVAIFLLGGASLWIIAALLPLLVIGRELVLHAAASAFVLMAIWRLIAPQLLPPDAMKQRVLVLGTGFRAQKIAARMRRRSDQRAFILCGFLERDPNSISDAVVSYGAKILHTDLPLLEFCRDNAIDEIVVAIDERRRNQDAGSGIPLDELMDCRLSGIAVCDVQQFIEREACKLDVDLLRPSWLVFADGFSMSPTRMVTKRLFDILAGLMLLLIFWPVMIVIALAIFLESGLRAPVLLRQERVGLNGKYFNLFKFRSMITNAEPDGKAVWASHNEDRVTRVGKMIRKSRLDELPQLFNVLRGEMSFVGPRPERPVFVTELNDKIPYYTERHRVKPGITGWAQLCYPYGASVQDAKEKLQYDLYYLKNHSILLDMIILLQTVEVVLVGEGAR